MLDPVDRAALLNAFDAILQSNGDNRAAAGLAVLRAMREQGAPSWLELFSARLAEHPEYGFTSSPWGYGYRPDVITPATAIRMVARRIDSVPAADLAELAILDGLGKTEEPSARATAIVARWDTRREADVRAER